MALPEHFLAYHAITKSHYYKVALLISHLTKNSQSQVLKLTILFALPNLV